MQIRTAPPASNNAASWAEYIKEIWEDKDNIRRKRDSKLVVDYYRYKQRQDLEEALKKIYSPESFVMKRKWTHNYTKQIIDALAQCYNSRVTRELNKEGLSDEEKDDVNALLFAGLNKAMANSNKWLLLERTTLMFARWSNKKQHMVYLSYNQYQFDLVFDPESDDKDLLAVILSDYRRLEEGCRITVYTKNKTFSFVGEELQYEKVHNIGVLPFVVMYAEDPSFEDYLEPLIELVNANLELNIAQSNMLNILQSQAHGLLVLKMPNEQNFQGIDDANPDDSHPTDIEGDRRIDTHDPNKVVELHYGLDGEEPKLESIPHHADFTGALDTVRFLANSLANSMGLDHGVFEVQVSTNPATVFHINEKRRQAIIGDYQSIFVDAERELFEKALFLARKSVMVLPDVQKRDFVVEFSPERAMVDKMDSADVTNLRQLGLIDSIEAVKHHYGSLSRDDAKAFIKKMVEDELEIRDDLEKLKPKQELTEEKPKEPEKTNN